MEQLVKSRIVWQAVLYGLFLSFMYYSSYAWLIGHDWARADYNYCYLIPFLLLYFVREKRKQWSQEPSVPSWNGFLILLAGVFLYLVGELAGEFFTLYVSSWFVVTGLLWMHVGRKKLATMAFPVFLSLFLYPLPHYLNTKLTFNLKLISSELGVSMIQLLGMSGYREGNIIDLGFTQLQVVDACSGLRYLLPLVLMGILMAYFYKASLWKRTIIVLSAVPLSIVTNSLRIALTAFLYPSLGPAAAEGFFHDFSGWVIFMASFGALLVEIRILRNILPRPGEYFMRDKDAARTDREPAERLETDERAVKKTNVSFSRRYFIAAASILVISMGMHAVIDFKEKKPVSRPFDKFPLVIGEWQGTRQFLDQQSIDTLEFTDYTYINYSKQNSPPVNIYVAYYESQRKGKSIHSPETCLPGSGWCFRQAGRVTIPLSGENPFFPVMRALMEKDDSTELVYFWFDQRGRILTNAYEMKIYNFWDALTKKRTDGALVRVITPISPSEKAEDADKRLRLFIKEITPTLNEFIPGPTV